MMLGRTCVALLATTLLATPAVARDKTLYVGVEGGLLWASDTDLDANDVPTGVGNATVDIDDFLTIDHKMGFDAGLIFGYDAGMVRAELDLSYKRVSHGDYDFHFSDGEGGIIDGSVDGDGSTRYVAIMTNLLFDAGNEDGFSFYAGPGLGFAWGKFDLDNVTGTDDDIKDGGVAWQLIAGVRYAVSPNIDLGLKYRYFHASRIKENFSDGSDIDGRFKSNSILATLTYNFYRPPPPPPPPPPPLPPPPEPGPERG